MIRRSFAALVVLLPLLALAGNSSLVVKDGNGSTQTLSQITDAANSSYLMGKAVVADPTNGYGASVKNASTAAVASDQALVVTLSPNNGVGGLAAAGATAVGAPVQAGGVYNTSPATLTNGQAGALQLDAGQNLLVRFPATAGNPCLDPMASLQTFYGATSGNALTQVIAASGSTKIYVCSVSVSGVSGTNPTISFSYGTGANCGTGTQTVIGPIATTANTLYQLTGGTVAATPASQALCYTGGGTTPVQQLAITYVQR